MVDGVDVDGEAGDSVEDGIKIKNGVMDTCRGYRLTGTGEVGKCR